MIHEIREMKEEIRQRVKNGISFAEVMKPENAGKIPTLN